MADLTEGLDSVMRLASILATVDGIGHKNALRAAVDIAASKDRERLLKSVELVVDKVTACRRCGLLVEGGEICAVCADRARDQELVCVVGSWFDAAAIERTGGYRGLYHVLGGLLNPLDGIGPADIAVQELLMRTESEAPREIIVATPMTSEGEATATFVANELRRRGYGGKITRIAGGVPLGASRFTRIDATTLSKAVENRREFA